MNRRQFTSTALLGWCLPSALGGVRLNHATDAPGRGAELFPPDAPDTGVTEFPAVGFSEPVCGFVHTRARPAPNGMPLGGIGTGYLDLETNGVFGDCTMFNSGVPLRPLHRPFLALRLPGRTWVLSTEQIPGLGNARDIRYWGHYPVADLEYDTGAPVAVGLRAWSPFVPGDVAVSNTPGAGRRRRRRRLGPAAFASGRHSAGTQFGIRLRAGDPRRHSS